VSSERSQIIKKTDAILAFALLFLIVGVFFVSDLVSAQTDKVDSELQAANDSVNHAFTAVLDAEKAGANVTSLLNQLNGATGLLSEAENAYRSGDSNTALNDATTVVLVAQQVMATAQSTKNGASALAQSAFWSTSVLTVLWAIMLIVVLFLVWRWFRQRYIRNLSSARSEVIEP